MAQRGATLGADALQRRGALVLLLREGAPPHLAASVEEAYYGDTSFDLIPSLCSAIREALAATDAAPEVLPLAMVLLDSQVHAVGIEEARLVGLRNDDARLLLAPGAEGLSWPRGHRCGTVGDSALYGATWRLLRDDVLVLTVSAILDRLNPRELLSIAGGRAPDAAARAIARRGRGARTRGEPVTVIHYGALRPVPELGPIRRSAFEPAPPQAPRPPREGRSPVWVAGAFALLAVALALWMEQPSWSRADAEALLTWIMTPQPANTDNANLEPADTSTPRPAAPTMVLYAGTPRATATDPPPTPTSTLAVSQAASATPTPPDRDAAPSPQLRFPGPNDAVDSPILALSWAWDGTLADDEYFDVRLWPIGTEKAGIAWTKDTEYIERIPRTGWFSWTVVVIRGADGVVAAELSGEPEPVSFRWSPDLDGTDRREPPTRLPLPTRPTAQPAPTRVAPTADSEDTT